MRTVFLFVAVSVGFLTCAHAANISTFDNESAFAAAASALTIVTEDFNGVSGDPQFSVAPVAVGDLTLTGTGSTDSRLNIVDEAPFGIPEFSIDGTTHAVVSIFRNEFAPGPADEFTIEFAQPTFAFAAEFIAFNEGPEQRTVISVLGETLLPPISLATEELVFFGFVSDTAFSSITFLPSEQDDNFGMDNVRYSATAVVPLPAGLPLLLTALATGALAARGRRRSRDALRSA